MGKMTQDLDTVPHAGRHCTIETEGNPEEKKVEVVGTSSEFAVDTFGKPKNVDRSIPKGQVLHYDNDDARRGGHPARASSSSQVGEYTEALKEYQKALDVTRNSSLAHYRVGELFFLQQNWQPAANEFREALQRRSDAQVDRSLVAHQPGQDFRHQRSAGSRGERISPGAADQGQHPRARSKKRASTSTKSSSVRGRTIEEWTRLSFKSRRPKNPACW